MPKTPKTPFDTCITATEQEIGKTERGQRAKARTDERWVHCIANEMDLNETKEHLEKQSRKTKDVQAASE